MQKEGNIIPKNGEEELLMMAGRVNALEAYIDKSTYVDREIVAAIMGFELKPQEEKEAESLKERGLLGILNIKLDE